LILCPQKEVSNFEDAKTASENNIPVLEPTFIEDCIDKKKLVSKIPFLVKFPASKKKKARRRRIYR